MLLQTLHVLSQEYEQTVQVTAHPENSGTGARCKCKPLRQHVEEGDRKKTPMVDAQNDGRIRVTMLQSAELDEEDQKVSSVVNIALFFAFVFCFIYAFVKLTAKMAGGFCSSHIIFYFKIIYLHNCRKIWNPYLLLYKVRNHLY